MLPLRGAKFSLFEGGLRVPALIAWPGALPVGATRNQLASGLDWVPTLLELTGQEAAEERLAGSSLVPVLRDAEAPSPHARLHWQRGARWAVRSGNWKLLFDPLDTSESSSPPAWLTFCGVPRRMTNCSRSLGKASFRKSKHWRHR